VTRVAHGDHDELSRLHTHVSFGVVLVDVGVAGFDGDAAAQRHGIAGIYGQVHNRLLDVVRIGLDVAGIGVQTHIEVDVFPNQAAQHVFGLPDDRGNVNDARLHDLAPAEGE
jgi:hypothetical protein